MECPGCAHINPHVARFCNSCGADLSVRCPACDSANPADARFCAYCGASQVAPTAESNGAEAVSQIGRKKAAPVVVGPEVPESFAGGRYLVQRFLGEGGKKKVYLVTDSLLDRDVAFSLIKTQGLDETGIERIKREAQLMGRLGDHPHIVSLYDIGEEGEQPYLVSQLMGGGDVEGLIERAPEHRPPLADTLRIADQVCKALEYAHRHGVIHRDLKPGNVWLTGDGTAKLGDFGLAMALDRTRLSVAGMIVGTVAYMPPEQALGRPADGRSDLYSLGAMLYEMVAGRPPFLGDDPVAIISQHINTQPVAPSWHNPDVPKPLEGLILRLLSKDPEARPESAAAVREELTCIQRVVDQKHNDRSSESISDEQPRNPLDRLAGGVFVGREKELEQLRLAVDAAFSGNGQVVLISGEPGIGKTSLAEEATTYARLRGAQVLWSRNYEWEGAPAYWTWVQLIRAYVHTRDPKRLRSELGTGGGIIAHVVSEVRALLPDLESSVTFEGEEARFRLFDAVANFLRAASRNQPLVLVLDDLHWADAPSLLLLQYVARELRDARVLIIGSYRDMEIGRHHPLAGTLAELAREQRLERMTLRGLSRPEMARYIELAAGSPPPAGFVDAIVEQTAGNPFFVAEVVRLMVSEGALERKEVERWSVSLPQGVREVLGRRLDRLSAACNELLAVASVIGREFELALLAEVMKQEPDQVLETLEEAIAARLLVEVDQIDSYRFSQELIREVLYEELSIARRRRLNGAVARALEGLHTDDLASHYAQLARHYAAAGSEDAEKAVEYAVKAGDRAMAHVAWEAAVDHFQHASLILEASDTSRTELELRVLLSLGDAQNMLSSWQDSPAARETFLRAVEAARKANLIEQFAIAALGYSGTNPLAVSGGGTSALDLLEEAYQMLPPGDSVVRARVAGRLGIAERWLSGDAERANSLTAEALAIAERLGDQTLEAYTLWMRLGARWFYDNLGERRELGERLYRVAAEAGDPLFIFAGIMVGKLEMHLEAGDFDAAREALPLFFAAAEDVPTPFVQRQIPHVQATWSLLEGRLADAQRQIRDAIAISAGDSRTSFSQLTFLRSEQGRFAELKSLVEERDREGDLFGLDREQFSDLATLVLSIEKGDRRRAQEAFERLSQQRFTDAPVSFVWAAYVNTVVNACVWFVDKRRAEWLYDLILPLENQMIFGGPAGVFFGSTHYPLGRLAAVLERWDDAERHLRQAVTIHEAGAAWLWRAHSQYAYADMLVGRGEPRDREQALTLVDQALAAAEDMGAIRLARKSLELKVQIQGILKA